MFDLTLRTVPAVIENAEADILEIIDGFTVKDCIGYWKSERENSIEFTTTVENEAIAVRLANLINFHAWKYGEQSIMFNIVPSNWTFTDCKREFAIN